MRREAKCLLWVFLMHFDVGEIPSEIRPATLRRVLEESGERIQYAYAKRLAPIFEKVCVYLRDYFGVETCRKPVENLYKTCIKPVENSTSTDSNQNAKTNSSRKLKNRTENRLKAACEADLQVYEKTFTYKNQRTVKLVVSNINKKTESFKNRGFKNFEETPSKTTEKLPTKEFHEKARLLIESGLEKGKAYQKLKVMVSNLGNFETRKIFDSIINAKSIKNMTAYVSQAIRNVEERLNTQKTISKALSIKDERLIKAYKKGVTPSIVGVYSEEIADYKLYDFEKQCVDSDTPTGFLVNGEYKPFSMCSLSWEGMSLVREGVL
jgi:hypothetical protein